MTILFTSVLVGSLLKNEDKGFPAVMEKTCFLSTDNLFSTTINLLPNDNDCKKKCPGQNLIKKECKCMDPRYPMPDGEAACVVTDSKFFQKENEKKFSGLY